MTPVMYVDLSGESLVLAIGFLVGGLISTIAWSIVYKKSMDIKLNYAKLNFTDEMLQKDVYARQNIDQGTRFLIYERAKASTVMLNGLRISLYTFTKIFDKFGISKNIMKPKVSLISTDMTLDNEAKLFVENMGYSVDESEYYDLVDYYAERYHYWEVHFND
jgi:hypothetical protein